MSRKYEKQVGLQEIIAFSAKFSEFWEICSMQPLAVLRKLRRENCPRRRNSQAGIDLSAFFSQNFHKFIAI